MLRHIQEHSARHNQDYSGIFRMLRKLAYSQPWYIQNPVKFRTRVVFRTLAERFVKIVNMLYEINIMNFLNTRVIFTPIVFTLYKKSNQGPGAMNFGIP